MDQDRRDAAAWAKEWYIKQRNRRVLMVLGVIAAIALIAYMVNFAIVHVERTTFKSVEDMRKEDSDLLLFDSGDFSQGSTYYNLFKGEVEVNLMNMMKYDAATIGNHEFDFGLSNMEHIFKMANFPIICSNYDFSKTQLADIVKPYTIIRRKGLKIGVLAVCTRLKGLVSEKNSGATVYLDPITEGNKVADYLKNEEKCDIVICLSHLGWNISGVDVEDEKFIKASRNIDIVLGGHSHSYFEHPETVINSQGKPVLCNQMGKNGQWVGVLDVEMKKK